MHANVHRILNCRAEPGGMYCGSLIAEIPAQNFTAAPELIEGEKNEPLHHPLFQSKCMSDADMAQHLETGPATIESHRKNLRSKLGARNAAEIVRIAMERGLVD